MFQFFLEKICKMKVFDLTNNNHFIYSVDGKTIAVADLPNNVNDYMAYESLFCGGYRVAAEVGRDAEYNVLEIFGVRIYGFTLDQLATDLKNTGCLTNREGYCILLNLSMGILGFPVAFGRKYSRLNDLFIWSKYGVVPTSSTTVWNRRDQYNNAIFVDNEQLLDKLSGCERSLQEEEDALKECNLRLTNLEKDYEDKYKRLEQEKLETEHVKAELESKKKEVSASQNSLMEEERVLEETNKELEECKRELEAKKKEILTSKKSSDDKEKLLVWKNCKSRELEVKKKSWNCEGQVGSTAELKKELCECKRSLEEKEKELTKLGDQLLAKQGAIEALMEVLSNFKKL